MPRRLLVIVAVSVAIGVAVGAAIRSGNEQDEAAKRQAAEEAYNSMMEVRHTYPEVKDRMAMTKEFLADYPETEHTAALLGHVFYYQGERLGDAPGAIAYAEGIRRQITDPVIATDVDKMMVELYGQAGMTDRMLSVAAELEAAGEMKFNNYWNVIEVATEHGDWGVVANYCEKARPLATAEAYRTQWSEHEFTDEEAEKAARNRRGMIAGKDAWAKANTGRVEEALAEFTEADQWVNRSYLGVPEYDFNLHWANTLIMKGRYDDAIDRLATEALVMGREEAVAALKEAYVGKNGGDSEFDRYAERLHRKVARSVDDFTLRDYKGTPHTFADLRGEVTLLAFWFPT
jgi:tetratricopeptide (TPR) repeat protein